VAKPDRKWGEVPCAFVTLKSNKDGETGSNAGSTLNETELIKWARQRMAGFQTPKAIVFVEDLPKTITGKVTKTVLKAQLAEEATE
jgi:fatty-acyl-CoA synthase